MASKLSEYQQNIISYSYSQLATLIMIRCCIPLFFSKYSLSSGLVSSSVRSSMLITSLSTSAICVLAKLHRFHATYKHYIHIYIYMYLYIICHVYVFLYPTEAIFQRHIYSVIYLISGRYWVITTC